VLRDVVQPLFEADGGSVELVGIQDGVVRVRLGGVYRGCPSTSYTVEGVIVPALRRVTGENLRVEVVV
jgi:Fe-S cluster biogenesis protein NfuA